MQAHLPIKEQKQQGNMPIDASFDWDSLHDAVLHSLGVDWEGGTARITLTLPSPPPRRLVVNARGVVWLSCPREQPWGRSIHVNEAKLKPAEGVASCIRIEMQSGDVIELRAEGFEADLTAEAHLG